MFNRRKITNFGMAVEGGGNSPLTAASQMKKKAKTNKKRTMVTIECNFGFPGERTQYGTKHTTEWFDVPHTLRDTSRMWRNEMTRQFEAAKASPSGTVAWLSLRAYDDGKGARAYVKWVNDDLSADIDKRELDAMCDALAADSVAFYAKDADVLKSVLEGDGGLKGLLDFVGSVSKLFNDHTVTVDGHMLEVKSRTAKAAETDGKPEDANESAETKAGDDGRSSAEVASWLGRLTARVDAIDRKLDKTFGAVKDVAKKVKDMEKEQ